MDDSASSRPVGDASAFLDRASLSDYYGPQSDLDEAITTLLNSMAEWSSDDWSDLLHSLTEHRQHALGRYALRAPMLALRTMKLQYLRAGLLAHCLIRRNVPDWRDDLVFFAPYAHVAQLMDADVTALFDDVAAYAVPELATAMQTFGRRTDITLGAFGWRQVEGPDGPTFETVNWNGVPSGAVAGERSWDEVNQAQVQKILDWVKQQSREDG